MACLMYDVKCNYRDMNLASCFNEAYLSNNSAITDHVVLQGMS